ncbi:MAG: transposase [Verrucomicrobiota bacterium]
MKHHPAPWDTASEKEYHQRFSSQINDWLDQGFGSCLLQEPRLANIIANAFHYFDQQRYKLSSFVIMPNHIHVLFQPLQKHRLPQIIKSWKGFTANHITRLTGSKGSLWQEDYWDRLIRNSRHFAKCLEYIRNNSGKAHLHKSQYLLYENINNSHGF